MIAALSLSPRGRRVHLFFALHPNENITARKVRSFLRHLCRHLRGPVVLVWDRLRAHRARLVMEFLDRRPRVTAIDLPPYAPELNPVEPFWSYLKMNPLAQVASNDPWELRRLASHHSRRIARRQPLLQSFIQATPFRPCLGRP
jgi:putative transposase